MSIKVRFQPRSQGSLRRADRREPWERGWFVLAFKLRKVLFTVYWVLYMILIV